MVKEINKKMLYFFREELDKQRNSQPDHHQVDIVIYFKGKKVFFNVY